MRAETRHQPDRRSRPTPFLSRYTFSGGRRRDRRRLDDPGYFYVDRIGDGLAILLVWTFIFHVLDAVLTLRHLSRGGTELNPLMDALIQVDEGLFLAVKLGLAGIGLFLLGRHEKFPHVRPAVFGLFWVFLGLVGYHVLLILAA